MEAFNTIFHLSRIYSCLHTLSETRSLTQSYFNRSTNTGLRKSHYSFSFFIDFQTKIVFYSCEILRNIKIYPKVTQQYFKYILRK